MKLLKIIRDWLLKITYGPKMIPQGLVDIERYFRVHGPIHFIYKNENGAIIALSENFRYGSIITSASTMEELDQKIKDAILTAFEIPSSYAKEARIRRTDQAETEYAVA